MDMVSRLYEKLHAAGFTITSDGLKLNVAGPVKAITPQLRRQITANRDSVCTLPMANRSG